MIRTVLTTTASAMALVMAVPAAAEQPDAHGSQPGDLDMLVQDGGDADDVPMPTMSFGDWGVDTSLLSDTIDPGDDFFAYVNQEWLDANPLPAEFSRFGAFNLLREKSTSDVKALVDELVAKPASELTADEKRIVEAYASYNDTAAIDAAGLAPAQPYLDKIRGAKTLSELVTLWGTPGYPAPMGGGVSVDAKEPTRYSVYLGSGGLGLPDRDYYLDDSERGKDIQTKYREYLTFLLKEAGYDDPAAMAESVYNFEDSIARKVSWDRATRRNRDLTYNALTPEELGALAGGFPLTALLSASGFADTDRFIVGDLPPSLEQAKELGLTDETLDKIGGGTPALMELAVNTPVEVLQAWTIKEFLENNASVLPSRFDEADFAFYGKVLQGTPEQRPRWKRAIGETEGLLGELLGKSYVAEYFPAENKAAMEELVANLRVALRQSIGEIDWMGEATKEEALDKLDSFDPKIGYRDNLETYQGLTITPGDPIANRMAAARWQWKDNLSKLGGPIDRTEWFMLPQTVNAYYNPGTNEICFPAGILQPPFFSPDAHPAENYGGIGAVIGHEIGHGFDDQGAQFDPLGNLRDWWTPDDKAAFEEKSKKLVAQYDALEPRDLPGERVNGQLTVGENIGDLGGLTIAHKAYVISTGGEASVEERRRLFLNWGHVWRTKRRAEQARQFLTIDPHSPAEFRANIVRNLDEFHEVFETSPGDGLWLDPEDRVRIW